MNKGFILSLVLLCFLSCAHIDVVRINDIKANDDGIIFYKPHPYLWVTQNKDDKLQGSIIWLPNMKEAYAIKARPGFGSVELKFTLENGWNLTQFGGTMDSESPELIEALTGTLAGVAEFRDLEMTTLKESQLGLYAFIFDEKTGMVIGLKHILKLNELEE